MRRVVLLLTVISVALLLASGVALAVSKSGGNGDDLLKGTNDRDTISGGGGDDLIYGKGASDQLYGNSGADEVHGNRGDDELFSGQGVDEVYGGTGDDFINTIDERVDRVIDCGPGRKDFAVVDIDEFERTLNTETCEEVHGFEITFGEAQGVTLETLTPETLTPETIPEGVSVKQVSP